MFVLLEAAHAPTATPKPIETVKTMPSVDLVAALGESATPSTRAGTPATSSSPGSTDTSGSKKNNGGPLKYMHARVWV